MSGVLSIDAIEPRISPADGYHASLDTSHGHTAMINACWCIVAICLPVPALFLWPSLCFTAFVQAKLDELHYILLPAWLFTTTAQVLIIVCLRKAFLTVGFWELSRSDATEETRLILIACFLAVLEAALAKLMLCVIDYKILSSGWSRRAVLSTAILTALASGALCLGLPLGCMPIKAAWSPRLGEKFNCTARDVIHIVQASISGVADVVLAVVMLKATIIPQQSRESKWRVLAFFGSGLLVFGIAVARLVVLASGFRNPDRSFVLFQDALCLTLESSLLIVLYSIPTFRRFVQRCWDRKGGTARSRPGREMNGGQGDPQTRTFGGTPMVGHYPSNEPSTCNKSDEVLLR